MEISALLPDEPLMQEGALRTYHLLAPLLALRAPRTHLLHKALAACHTVLSALSNLVQDSLHRQEAQRELSARVAAAVTYQLLRLSDTSGEGAAAAHFGRLQVELLKAYDPRVSVPGRLVPPTELQDEAARLHEVVLQHPRLVEWGPEAVIERQKEAGDLVARALPLIASAAPMDAWVQVLGFESATDHPRWVELVVRMLEAALRRGNPGNALAVVEELRWWVRTRSKVPPMGPAEEGTTSGSVGGPGSGGGSAPPGTPGGTAPQPPTPKWSVEAAAAALAPSQVGFEAPPPPATDGMSADEAAAAKAQHAEEVRKTEEQQRRQVAAVMLLQQRLPRLLARKRAIERTRANIKRWSPWLARLNIMLGLTAAAEARSAALNTHPSALNPQPTALDGDRPSSPSGPPATGPNAEAPLPAAPSPPPPPGTADGDGEVNPEASGPPPDGMAPALRAMIHFARAAQLAARAGAWLEVGNAARHAWNLKQSVLNANPSLTAPLPRVVWERGLLPEPPPPPAESMLVPATPPVPEKKGAKEGGKKGGKEEKKKEEKKPEKKAGKAGKKKGAAEEAPPATPRTYPLPTGSRPNMARSTRALTEALLALVSGLREGMVMHTWVLPRLGQDDGKGAGGSGRGGAGGRERPGSAVVADSEFSYGSDLQVDIWFREGPLDLGWVSRFMNGVAVVLSRGERWHSLLALGSSWAKISEGAFNERLMPWLLMAAPKVGMDSAAFQAALDTLVRDKNQALDQLDKVRTLVRERLGETPLLSTGMGHKVRKKRRPIFKRASLTGATSAMSLDGRPGTSSTTATGDGGMSMVGGMPQSEGSTTATYRTATTYRTRASQPDFLRIPTEYEKVIEMLKRRNEKAALHLALSELGDVHAHFGSWGPASTAWNDALDSLLGPYQAIRNWRPKLTPLAPAATLQAYGLHGLLLGAILTGKLARYTYHDHLTLRLEACRLGARLVFTAFSVHLGHPQRLLGFATYTPRELWAAGADGWTLWADAYRCPVSDLVGALETLTACLLDAGLALEALPVVALWEHLVRYVVRSLHGTVLCRLMRVRALAALGLLGEGMGVVGGLMGAAGLPDATLESDYVLKDASGAVVQVPPAPPFNNASLPGDSANKAALLHLADTPLPPAVERLYGSWLVAHLSLVRAQLLLLAGGVPNQWRATNWRTGERVEMPKPVTPPAKGKAAGGKAAAGGAAGGKAAAGGAAAASAAAAAVTSMTSGQDAVGIGLPEVMEPALLERANVLLRRAMAMARGEEQPSTDGSVASAPATSKGAGKGAARASSPGKGRAKSPLSSARGGRPATPSTPPPPPSGPPVPGAPTAGQRAEVMVRTLLLLCELEQLRWQPARALGHALEAAHFLGNEADRVNVPQQGDNDELERYCLSPVLWFLARAAAVRCAAQLGHGPHVRELTAAAATREASAVQEQLQTAGMEHMAALVLAAEGRTAEALTGLTAVAARYRALSVVDTRLGAVLLDEAALRDRLGLRGEAAELAEQGLEVAEGWAMELGLGEALGAPELTNVYSDGTALYAHALGVAAVHATRQRRHVEAERHAQAALRLLRQHTRGLPTQHAAAALTLGRMSRLAALCGSVEEDSNVDGAAAGNGASVAATAAKLSAARNALSAAITLASIDGGHLRGVIRSALLELASICIAGLDHRGAAACLRSAHVAAVQQDLVLLSGHSLVPVAVGQLPEWVTTALRGQEAHFAATANGRKPDAAAAPALSDADVGRMTVCMLAGLLRSLERQPVGGGFCARAEAKLAALHSVLKFACAKYGMDACFAEPPLPPGSNDAASAAASAAAAVLKEGVVIAQWHCQDGCWQESRSFVAEGRAPSGTVSAAPSDTQLLALPPVESYASLLYVVGPSGGAPPQCGEVTFPVAQVREVADRVQQLRARMERPKAPTDILGYPPPSSVELADLMRAVERLLTAAPRGSDDGTSSSLGGPLVSGLEGSLSGAVVPSGKQVAGEVRPALELAFLRQLEALLSLDAGLDVSDGTLATWMLQTLPVQL